MTRIMNMKSAKIWNGLNVFGLSTLYKGSGSGPVFFRSDLREIKPESNYEKKKPGSDLRKQPGSQFYLKTFFTFLFLSKYKVNIFGDLILFNNPALNNSFRRILTFLFILYTDQTIF